MGYKKVFDYGVNIHTYEFNPKDERLAYEFGKNMKLETIDKLPRPKKDELVRCVTNWNFFDWVSCFNGYGEIEIDGKQIQAPSVNFPSLSFKDYKLTYGDIKDADIGLGIGMLLVKDGKKCIINNGKVPTGKNTRTAFGQKKNGNIFIVVCEGNTKKGMSEHDMADFLIKNGVIIGAMGDSGGSSSMMNDGIFVYKNVYRPIACGLVVYSKYKIDELPVLSKKLICMKGMYVDLLQRLLGIKNDGVFGNDTKNAVLAFQKKHGLKQDGVVGQQTWKALTKGII